MLNFNFDSEPRRESIFAICLPCEFYFSSADVAKRPSTAVLSVIIIVS